MKIQDKPPVHLTYCLNIHPGETWPENFAAIKDKALAVRKQVCPDTAFGLGLRLGNEAAAGLLQGENLAGFKSFLSENNLYVFTINGFPYGSFHGTRVKENVYQPDWRTRERLDYTIMLADVLKEILPADVKGSISTVPGSYKRWIRSDADLDLMVRNLIECVRYLDRIYKKTGKTICLALEPEPDCFIEKTAEAVKFFNDLLFCRGAEHLAALTGTSKNDAEEGIRRHLGICFDTCHIALQFEDIETAFVSLVDNGISVPKIQLSSAVRAVVGRGITRRFISFIDQVYLHQVRIKGRNGVITSYDDLTMELIGKLSGEDEREMRAHFHVPLYFYGDGDFGSTSYLLARQFFNRLLYAENYLEIETYTYSVLPAELRSRDVSLSVIDEFKWVREKLARASDDLRK